eukprot:scaffold7914_cov214-Alexandrium_tamarense.AAC.9
MKESLGYKHRYKSTVPNANDLQIKQVDHTPSQDIPPKLDCVVHVDDQSKHERIRMGWCYN